MSFVRLAPGSSRPLLPIAQFFIVGFTIFVLAGGLFVLAQGGQGLLNVSRGLQWVYPGDVNNQTTLEAVFSGLVYILGFRRCLYDVHEHTLRLSSKASLRLS